MRLVHRITLQQMMESDHLEEKYYGREHISGWEKSWEWYQLYPWMTRFVEEDGKIAGLLDFFPVTNEYLEKMLSGELGEDDLASEHILDLNIAPPGVYPMFLFTILVDEIHRGKGALEMLFADRFSYYDSLAGKGIRFGQVVTENVTVAGCRFSERLGLEKALVKEGGSTIYSLPYLQFRDNALKRLKGR